MPSSDIEVAIYAMNPKTGEVLMLSVEGTTQKVLLTGQWTVSASLVQPLNPFVFSCP